MMFLAIVLYAEHRQLHRLSLFYDMPRLVFTHLVSRTSRVLYIVFHIFQIRYGVGLTPWTAYLARRILTFLFKTANQLNYL